MLQVARLAALLFAALLVSSSTVEAQPRSLPSQLSALVRAAGLGDQIGVHIVRVSDGHEIFSHHGDLGLNPASNMKIVTAASAMLELGPAFTMTTGVYGRVEAGAVQDLSLVGYGDPSLRMSDLVELADGIAARGVRRVGTVIVDGTYFDEQMLPPAFEQQPNEVSSFRSAIAAVAVERSAYVLRVIPGGTVGGPAEVRLACAGYFEVDNQIVTGAVGSASNVIAVQSGDGERMTLRLRGSIPQGILGASYRRRVENPIAYAAHCMVDALARVGVRASGRVRIAPMPAGSPLLTARTSAPLAELLTAMGKWSDNFTAEMMLKVLGAERHRPGSSAQGAERALGVLGRAGVTEGVTMVNGSGLFEGNRIAPSHLTSLLSYVYRSAAVRDEFLAHLAVGGRDGTLARRLTDLPASVVVRAKTGTLDDAIALSGYVVGSDPGETVAFSFLANGIRGRQGAARALADDIVRALAVDIARD